jgi:hypothetical protein
MKKPLPKEILAYWLIDRKPADGKPRVLSDPGEIRRLLIKAFNQRDCILHAVVAKENIPLKRWFAELDPDAGIILIKTASSTGRVPAELVRLAESAEEAMFMVFAGNQGVAAFRARVESAGERWLSVPIPAKVVFTQKRKAPRYSVPSGYELWLDFLGSDGSLRGRILNLSVSGISFTVAGVGPDELERSVDLRRVVFSVQNRRIRVELAVIRITPLASSAEESGVRVHARFARIRKQDQEMLAGYILESLIQYHSSL